MTRIHRLRALALRTALVLGAAALLAAAPGAALATALGTSALGELMGSRDVTTSPSGGLTGFNGWDNEGDADGPFTVSWNITLGGGSARYEYTFTGLGDAGGPQVRDIGSIVLDISDDCANDPACFTNVIITNPGEDPVEAETEFGNRAGITGALKIDGASGMEGVTYAFDSNRLPVYGHLAVKGGGGPGTCPTPGSALAVCNNQLLGIGDPDEVANFVAVPNGVVPEPGTALLLGAGLGGLALAGRRRR